ncbi:MAG: cell division protein FtsZ [Ignavibacteria bacterium GWF2_33_9]|nr:MAG: cell division protein FtsZ [Ignavibacteria bacterium GWF2_33_9]
MPFGNKLSIDLAESDTFRAKIKVIGVGGGGCNAIDNMIEKNYKGVELISANTDSQALNNNKAHHKIQLGVRTTKGLGAGSDPERGKKAAEESEQEISDVLMDAEMVFVTCGMGGGTGTGAAPVVARIAKEQGSLVVAIVTKPFAYEGVMRNQNAINGIYEISKVVDAYIVIPNQKIYDIIGEDTDIDIAFEKIDEILMNATKGISDIINIPGKINVDFGDVSTIMKEQGPALMGIGIAEGDNRGRKAAENAFNSPLLDGISIEGANKLLVNISGGHVLTMTEINEVTNTITSLTGNNVHMVLGAVKTNEDSPYLSVTVVATGFKGENYTLEEVKSETKTPVTSKKLEPIFVDIRPKETSKPRVDEVIKDYKYNDKYNNPNGNSGNGYTGNGNRQNSNKDNDERDLTIPKGNTLKYYDEPAYLRKGHHEEDNKIPNERINTFEEVQKESDNKDMSNEIEIEREGYDFFAIDNGKFTNNFSNFTNIAE